MPEWLTIILALLLFALMIALGILALAMTPVVLDAIVNIQNAVRNSKKN